MYGFVVLMHIRGIMRYEREDKVEVSKGTKRAHVTGQAREGSPGASGQEGIGRLGWCGGT
jgi:hypothetical protein